MIKKISIWIVRSLISLVIVTLIFSAIMFDFPNLIKGVFGDIFKYASPDAQNQVASKLAEACSSLDRGESVLSINQSGFSLLPDFSKMGALCQDYKAERISNQEFFFGVVGSAFGSQMKMPEMHALKSYNEAMNYLNNNKIIYFVILLALAALLYALIMDVKIFLMELAKISFSIGIMILLPYLGILAYENFVGIDTTPVLGAMIGAGSAFNFKAVLSIVLLMFLRAYNSLIMSLGILFLTVGIAGKIYFFVLKRKNNKV